MPTICLSVFDHFSVLPFKGLRTCFVTHGIPQICVSDNGSCFTSEEFESFMKKNSIHPLSFGYKLMQFKKLKESGSLKEKLNTLLFTYRLIPQSTTGFLPAELLMNRKLNPKLEAELNKNVLLRDITRQFKESDEVCIRNFSIGNNWTPEQFCVVQVPYLIRR